jgi:hypothetical protein
MLYKLRCVKFWKKKSCSTYPFCCTLYSERKTENLLDHWVCFLHFQIWTIWHIFMKFGVKFIQLEIITLQYVSGISLCFSHFLSKRSGLMKLWHFSIFSKRWNLSYDVTLLPSCLCVCLYVYQLMNTWKYIYETSYVSSWHQRPSQRPTTFVFSIVSQPLGKQVPWGKEIIQK